MTDRRKHDDPLAGLTARTLAAGMDRPSRECPEPEILAACFERSLPADEFGKWESHFSHCGRCQEQLALLARMETVASPSEQAEARRFSWFWSLRWLAPAAAALAVLTLWVVQPREVLAPRGAEPTLTAENQAPPVSLADQVAQKNESAQEGTTTASKDEPTSGGKASRASASEELPASVSRAKNVPMPISPPADANAAAFSATRQPAEPQVAAAEPVAVADRRDAPAESKDKKEAAAIVAASEARKAAEKPAEVQVAQAPLAKPPATGERENTAQPAAALGQEQAFRRERDELAKNRSESATDRLLMKQRAANPGRGLASELPSYVSVNVVGSSTVWRLGPGGAIERSDDKGSTWERQASGVSTDLLAGSAPSASTCWIVGRGGTVLRTIDGKKWVQVGSPSALDLVSVEATGANHATVTTSEGKRYVTSDGGRTWQSK